MNDLLAGQVQMLFDNFPTGYAQVRAGKLRALAVTSPARFATAPDIPALAETVPGYVAVGWFRLRGRRHDPRPLVERLATELGTALRAARGRAPPARRRHGGRRRRPRQFWGVHRRRGPEVEAVVEQSGAKAD